MFAVEPAPKVRGTLSSPARSCFLKVPAEERRRASGTLNRAGKPGKSPTP